MAEAQTNFTQAVDKIREWYHSLRVDHLSQDELDFELDIRSIIIRDDPTYSRRRRSLRDHLKSEKEKQTIIEVVLEVNWEETIQTFRQYYDKLCEGLQQNDKNLRVRGQAKLLHFGHRIVLLLNNSADSGEGETFLRSMLMEVVSLLEKYFYTGKQVPSAINPDGLSDEPLLDLFRLEGDLPAAARNVVVGREVPIEGTMLQGETPVASQYEGSDCVLQLKARIKALEAELNNRDKSSSEGVQTNESGMTSSKQLPSSERRANTEFLSAGPTPRTSSYPSQYLPMVSTANPITSVTFSIPQSYSSVLPPLSTSWHNHLLKTSNVQPQSYTQPANTWLGNPAGNASASIPCLGSTNMTSTQLPNPWLRPSNMSGMQHCNPWLGNPSNAPIPSSSIGSGAPISNLFPNPSLTPFNPVLSGNQGRNSLPVSKWTITKYDGEDQGLKMNQFLGMVHAMAVAEHASEAELFDSAIHLFKGPALQWYMTMRATGRLLNWQHLLLELRRTFMHPDLDTLIKMKVYQRHQSRNETFLQYYHGMEELFGTMSVPLPEYEKVQILMQNMRIDYKKQLNFLPIADLPTLVAAGQKIDSVNFSVYNKVFGSDKSVNVVESPGSTTKLKPEKHPNQLPSCQQPPHVGNSSQTNRHQKGSQSHDLPRRGSTRPQSTLEEMIASHQPLSKRHCFNCGVFGHRIDQCRLPKGVLCENCGFRGYPSNNCPFCVKNAISASQNRRSLSQNH
ncbi:uncharacterized protein LOC134203992 [Armigeres subalbatus]|uniref:uncharacterized protein LOC134203992 n=1 Tax=Armigeres subalbatus TaxID=124917 RepID=UPI002ED183BB